MSSPGAFDFHMTIETTDLERLMLRLETSLSAIGLSTFLTGAVLPWLRERAESRFTSEGDDVSGRWVPLAPSTQDIRSRGDWGVGSSHPINKRTGDLEDYITRSGSTILPWSEGAILVYPDKPPGPVMETKVRTAQSGKSHPRTPARPVLGLGERDMVFVMQALSVFVSTGAIR